MKTVEIEIGSPAWKRQRRRAVLRLGSTLDISRVPARARAMILSESPATKVVRKREARDGLWIYSPKDGDGFPLVVSGI